MASPSSESTWGHEDAFIWAGRSALAAGDTAAARRYYAQALEVNPGNGWVSHLCHEPAIGHAVR